MNCKLVLSHRSQFFHSRLFFSSQAKLRSTTQRLGIDEQLVHAATQCHALNINVPGALPIRIQA